MPTASRRAAAVAAGQSLNESDDPASRPFLRFHHSQALRVKTLKVLETVENAERASAHSGQLTELVLELTECGMDQYFMKSLRAAKPSFVVQKSAALGLAGILKVMGTVIRGILGHMDDRQLLSICASIRKLMV